MKLGTKQTEGYMGGGGYTGVNCGMFNGDYNHKQKNAYIKQEFKKLYPNFTYSVRCPSYNRICVSLYAKDKDIVQYSTFKNAIKKYVSESIQGVIDDYSKPYGPEVVLIYRYAQDIAQCTPGELRCCLYNGLCFNPKTKEQQARHPQEEAEAERHVKGMYEYAIQNGMKHPKYYSIPQAVVVPKLREAKQWLEDAYTSFNYDHSNAMVDYFQTGFYFDIGIYYKAPNKRNEK